jgi:hypothetical protein
MIDFLISLFIKPDAVVERRAYVEPPTNQIPSEVYNEVMRHQYEMRKQLYKELKLK